MRTSQLNRAPQTCAMTATPETTNMTMPRYFIVFEYDTDAHGRAHALDPPDVGSESGTRVNVPPVAVGDDWRRNWPGAQLSISMRLSRAHPFAVQDQPRGHMTGLTQPRCHLTRREQRWAPPIMPTSNGKTLSWWILSRCWQFPQESRKRSHKVSANHCPHCSAGCHQRTS